MLVNPQRDDEVGLLFPEEWPEILHDFARTIKQSKCSC